MGGGNVRTYPGDSRRLAYVDARPRAHDRRAPAWRERIRGAMSLMQWDDGRIRLMPGDCRDLIAMLPDNSLDSVVTDPPYEIGFMNRGFDSTGIAFDVILWKDILRVLKPGGHVAAFAASRTYHRLACAIEDAGFEIRDQIDWVYASGMPPFCREGAPAFRRVEESRHYYSHITR